ncbi:MAG: response regulator [Candidatus Magnetobacterium sp. LHC-1]|nr:response regulator [Nitrospirota bacterium]
MTIPKVLLIEDDKKFNVKLKEFIEQQGFYVDSYVSAPEALTVIYSVKDNYDFVVCDMRMPFYGFEDGGVEIAKVVSKQSPSSFIIMISNYFTTKFAIDFMRSMPHKRVTLIDKDKNLEKQLIDIFNNGLAKRYIFVCMPFDKKFTDVYKLGIKPTVEQIGFICERADEIQHNGGIIEKVYGKIRSAYIIIADMTGQNANVFYEVGYAHASEKDVILLTQKAEDIPFDLRNFNHVIYDGQIHILKEKLEERIITLFQQV